MVKNKDFSTDWVTCWSWRVTLIAGIAFDSPSDEATDEELMMWLSNDRIICLMFEIGAKPHDSFSEVKQLETDSTSSVASLNDGIAA